MATIYTAHFNFESNTPAHRVHLWLSNDSQDKEQLPYLSEYNQLVFTQTGALKTTVRLVPTS